MGMSPPKRGKIGGRAGLLKILRKLKVQCEYGDLEVVSDSLVDT